MGLYSITVTKHIKRCIGDDTEYQQIGKEENGDPVYGYVTKPSYEVEEHVEIMRVKASFERPILGKMLKFISGLD